MFEDISYDIIFLIADCLHPKDLVAFALAQRHALAGCAIHLKRHRLLLKRFSKVTIADGMGPPHYRHPLLLLLVIQRDPLVAYCVRYTRYIEYACDHYSAVDESVKDIINDRRLVANILQDSAMFQICNYPTGGILNSVCGTNPSRAGSNPSLALLLLLTMLPNVQRLRLAIPMRQIVYLRSFDLCTTRHGTNSKLERIEFCPSGGDPVDVLKGLAELPSISPVKSIAATRIQVKGGWLDIYKNWKPHYSELQNLSLTECDVTPRGLERLLDFTHGLRVFEYSPSRQGRNRTWDAAPLFDRLAAAKTSASLETLILSCPTRRVTAVQSLMPFKNLRNFRGPVWMLPVKRNRDTDPKSVGLDLSRVFPPSIEDVTLLWGKSLQRRDSPYSLLSLSHIEAYPNLSSMKLIQGGLTDSCATDLTGRGIVLEQWVSETATEHERFWEDDPPTFVH